MTSQAFAICKSLFEALFRLFTGFYIPGTNMTPMMFFAGVFIAMLAVRTIKNLFAGSGGD